MKELILGIDRAMGKLRNTIFSTWGKVVLGFFSAGLVLVSSLPGDTYSAVQTVDLSLSGTGSMPWNVSNVAPGRSDTKTITLYNSGAKSGLVTIWLSNVISTEGANPTSEIGNTAEPGELDKYLTLSVSGAGVVTNLAMPTRVADFPQSPSSPNYVHIYQMAAGASVELTWAWSLPVTTGNEVQGDTIRFDVNYIIDESDEPPPAAAGGGGSGGGSESPSVPSDPNLHGPVKSIKIEMLGVTATGLIRDGVVVESVTLTSPETGFSLTLDAGTQIINPDSDEVPQTIQVTVSKETILSPEGWMIVSPVFEINGVTYGISHHLVLSQPAKITIAYDPDNLPSEYDDIGIFYYDPSTGTWVRLEQPEGYVAEVGAESAIVNHFSTFSVLVEPAEGAIVKPAGPAQFTLSNLAVGPARIIAGQEASIKVLVVNGGGKVGEYPVTLFVNGVAIETRTVTLGPLDRQEVYFTFTPPGAGNYQIQVGGQTVNVKVVSASYKPPAVDIPWHEIATSPYTWMILAAMGIVVLVALLVRTRKA